jgi:hypothetical protein
MVKEVIFTKSQDVKHGINIKTFNVNIPLNHTVKKARIHVDADFKSWSPIGFSTVRIEANGMFAGMIGTKTFPNYYIDPIEFDIPLRNGINTVVFDVVENYNQILNIGDEVMIYADIVYEIEEDENQPPIPPDYDICKTCKQQGKLCDGKRCIDNIGKSTKILNKNFIAGAVEGNKPVTHVDLVIDVPIKSGDKIITSNIYTKVNATRISASILDIFYISKVNVSVNGDRVTSLNLEQDLFVNGKIKEDTNNITLRKGRNEVKFDLDFGQAGLQYDIFSDIYIKTEKGDLVTVKVVSSNEYGTGGIKPIDIGLGLLPIVLGLGAVILLSTGGGRSIVYRGAKAGYKKIKNR